MPPRKRAASAPKPETEGTVAPLAEDDSDDPAAEQPDEPKPERSDLQPVDAPCLECFPNGWPEQSFAVGCTHSTWKRD
ncbi:hypothetical protein [Streptomyces mirabilis]|uniref:hypothetical protein n=1 Tax=Streptomyces mirabilis TaxID=68239 RepID=UPI003405315C